MIAEKDAHHAMALEKLLQQRDEEHTAHLKQEIATLEVSAHFLRGNRKREGEIYRPVV